MNEFSKYDEIFGPALNSGKFKNILIGGGVILAFSGISYLIYNWSKENEKK